MYALYDYEHKSIQNFTSTKGAHHLSTQAGARAHTRICRYRRRVWSQED